MAVLFVITYGLQSTLVTVLSLLLLLREIRNRTKVNNNILSHGDTSYDGLDRALIGNYLLTANMYVHMKSELVKFCLTAEIKMYDVELMDVMGGTASERKGEISSSVFSIVCCIPVSSVV